MSEPLTPAELAAFAREVKRIGYPWQGRLLATIEALQAEVTTLRTAGEALADATAAFLLLAGLDSSMRTNEDAKFKDAAAAVVRWREALHGRE